jgi:hypothetical protein
MTNVPMISVSVGNVFLKRKFVMMKILVLMTIVKKVVVLHTPLTVMITTCVPPNLVSMELVYIIVLTVMMEMNVPLTPAAQEMDVFMLIEIVMITMLVLRIHANQLLDV